MENEEEGKEVRIVMELKLIPLDKIQPNPFQPRESFERESLKELADSMKDASVIHPIVVRLHGKGYQIIAGERRWRAAQMVALEEIPCIVKDVSEERILLESLIENLHRKDLTDIERENAIHELWESKKFKTKTDLARKIGVPETRVWADIEAWEFRHKEALHGKVSTRTIRGTRGLPTQERKRVIRKVSTGEFRVSDVDKVTEILKKAPEPIKEELLKPKSRLTRKMAETIVTKLPTEEEQKVIVEEIQRFRLTEDEVEDRAREIKKAKEMGKPLRKEMGVKEGIVYTVGEYECPNCKKHYWIRCNGKKDWVE